MCVCVCVCARACVRVSVRVIKDGEEKGSNVQKCEN